MARSVVLSNGSFAAAFDARGLLRDCHWPGLGADNHLLGRICDIGITVHGATFWAGEKADADPRRGIAPRSASTEIRFADVSVVLRVDDRVFDDMPLLLRTFTLERAPATRLRLLLHHDFRIGETDFGNGVRRDDRSGLLIHYRRDRVLGIALGNDASREAIVEWTLGRRDDHGGRGIRFEATRAHLSRNPAAIGAGESMIAVDLDGTAGGRRAVTLALMAGHTLDDVIRIADSAFGRTTSVIANATEAASTSETRRDPSASAERIATCLEILEAHVDRHGGIVASLDSDVVESARDTYGYVWMRDGAFIADTLRRAGRSEPARRFFHFASRCLGSGGYFGQRYTTNGEPGTTWHAIDPHDAESLPIQEDETALVLWALARAATSGLDVDDLFMTLAEPAAAFLLRYRLPEHDLVRPSFDLWEERRGIHFFTQVSVAAALRAMRSWAKQRGHTLLAESCETTALALERGIERHFFHKDAGTYARTLHRQPEGGFHLDVTPDASCFQAFLLDDVRLEASRITSTHRLASTRLRVDAGVTGTARYVDDYYWKQSHDVAAIPGNPWPLCEFWRARCERSFDGASARPPATSGFLSSGLWPEQIHPLTGGPLSVSPLPWTHAAEIDWLLDLRELP